MRFWLCLAFWTTTTTLLFAEDPLPEAKELFQQLDKNRDGKLTADEVPQEQARFFERLLRVADKNKDGLLSEAEFTQGHEADQSPELPFTGLGAPRGRGPGNLRKMFERWDQNKDGKITLDEVPEPARPRLMPLFERLGKDALSRDDLRGVEQMPSEDGPRSAGRGPLFLRKLDANGDGRLSREELSKVSILFEELDENRDGELDARELMGPPPEEAERGSQRPAPGPMLAQLDKDADGKLSKDEVPRRLKERFDRLDRNGDGYLTPEELREVFRGGEPASESNPKRPKRPPTE